MDELDKIRALLPGLADEPPGLVQAVPAPPHNGPVAALFVDGVEGRGHGDAVLPGDLPAPAAHAPGVAPVPEVTHSLFREGRQILPQQPLVHAVTVPFPGRGEIRPVHHQVAVAFPHSLRRGRHFHVSHTSGQ